MSPRRTATTPRSASSAAWSAPSTRCRESTAWWATGCRSGSPSSGSSRTRRTRSSRRSSASPASWARPSGSPTGTAACSRTRSTRSWTTRSARAPRSTRASSRGSGSSTGARRRPSTRPTACRSTCASGAHGSSRSGAAYGRTPAARRSPSSRAPGTASGRRSPAAPPGSAPAATSTSCSRCPHAGASSGSSRATRPAAAPAPSADPPLCQDGPVDGERRRGLLRGARLYLVTDGDVDVVREAIAGGVDLVQLRMKDAPDERVLEAAGAFREACPLLIVNDRPDLALACGADGVHVGQDDMALDEARTLVGDDLIVGVSTHSPKQVDAALDSPADYLGVGPVYSTPTKPGREPVGLELVRYAAAHASAKPWF